MGINAAVTRLWCERLAKTLRSQRIDRDGRAYLTRYFVAGWSPHNKQAGPAVFLHHFVASDSSDHVHSHPWGWSCSLILAGGYREQRCTPDGPMQARVYHPGDLNLLGPNDRHRVDLLEADCWTLFLAGDVVQSWGFYASC